MEGYIVYLFYLALLLILGVIITGISSNLKLSNILFLVLAGYILKISGISFFSEETILILSALALILIVLETTMKLDLKHIKKNFMYLIKFNIIYFIISSYVITLAIFMFFDLPGKQFEQFILCFLLSIIIYGVDSSIAMEFFKDKKKKIHELLEIEGFISGPIVVIFAFFVIKFATSSIDKMTSAWFEPITLIGQQIIVAIIIGIFTAYILYFFNKNFPIPKEIWALSIITTGILSFVIGELIHANGSLAVAVYGLLLKGLTKKKLPKEYTAILAHILFIIVFLLFGMHISLPSINLWIKGIILFTIYLLIRFSCVAAFLRDLEWREKIFMSLNVAKGIEVALVLFIMQNKFRDIVGIQEIISIGFMFFILSYIISTATNFFSDKILCIK